MGYENDRLKVHLKEVDAENRKQAAEFKRRILECCNDHREEFFGSVVAGVDDVSDAEERRRSLRSVRGTSRPRRGLLAVGLGLPGQPRIPQSTEFLHTIYDQNPDALIDAVDMIIVEIGAHDEKKARKSVRRAAKLIRRYGTTFGRNPPRPSPPGLPSVMTAKQFTGWDAERTAELQKNVLTSLQVRRTFHSQVYTAVVLALLFLMIAFIVMTLPTTRTLVGNVDNIKKLLTRARNAPTLTIKSQTTTLPNTTNATNSTTATSVDTMQTALPIAMAAQDAVTYTETTLVRVVEALDDKKDIQIRAEDSSRHGIMFVIAITLLFLEIVLHWKVEDYWSYIFARCVKFWHLSDLRHKWVDHAKDEPRSWLGRNCHGERLRYTLTQLAHAISPP